ncbi:[protein-PII] uridylyltransferase [Coraliomargarita sp. SDUM461003]|uniref:Bifunctional uridylyltransferase/uridylyl-removing enzyme n=1 Tax=Thalassobacterium maritimum TaxID=3041265 RepID=A0ABU1AVK8_9BACT|nr:[protein-PII] uridylyltransferase [Coraliomargarita sp. SDUM461003]MDQ8207170.1 [protein-PII] uridylyltransferase [Coraliomargarita sp. SDUM461003]
MPIQDNPLFRRLHQHAQKRLVFDPGVSRSKQLPAYKRYMQLENVMLERMHHKGESGRKVCQARAAMIDVVIENLFLAALDLYATEHGALPCKMAILATGGYGRRELNPHSDIDIMFLYPLKAAGQDYQKFQEVVTEEVLYPLWDLGLKVGHASRNSKEVIEECRKEVQSKNAILESRIICGSEPLYKSMRSRFEEFVKKENSKVYIQQRLQDELERHAKSGNTIYLQEPDIKNGVGGLRDYQNILWMAHIKYGFRSFRDLVKAKLLRDDERKAMVDSYDFLLRARTELHLQNRRPTDKLDLEQQPNIAEKLDYPQKNIFERVESFMKDYYTAARTIYQTSEMLKERMALEAATGEKTRISFREALRAHQHLPIKKVEGFQLHEKVLSVDSPNVFKDDPVRLIRIFRLAQQFGARLDPDLRYLITRSIPLIDHNIINSKSAAKSFCSILRSPGEVYPILMQMHEMGVLGRYLPEFGELTCMVQHEYYHRYTADAHVLRTIRHLDRVFSKHNDEYSRYEKELRKNDDPLLLYLILLLHDIGKAEGVKDHDVNGVRIAQPILNRFDIGQDQQEQILFIIRSHLEMARFWQRFDLDDPKTAASFAEFIEDPQKLRFLYVHTYCDARGTAPTLWNSYKDAMHRTLYVRTLEQFEDDAIIEQKRKNQINMLHQQLLQKKLEGISEEEIEAHFNLLPERYFINTHQDDIELHLRMVHRLLDQIQSAESMASLAPIIDWHDDIDLSMSVIDVVTWDRAGLFYKLAGALTLAGVNIVSTKAITRKDHITIDTFYVMDPDGGVVSNKKAREVFERHLHEALIEEKELMPEINELESKILAKTKTKDMLPAPFPPSVDVYHELSLKQTIIEVQASDRIGLLYQLSRLITKKGFDIGFARIATERGVAMDTFYIKNDQSEKDSYTTSLLELREELDKIVKE